MAAKIKVDQIETVDGSGTIALQNQLSGMTSASMPTGSVLQVVNVDNSSVVTVSTGGSYADIISAAITPSSTSSKILINFYTSYYKQGNSSSSSNSSYKILRGSTEIEGTYWHYADATTVTNWWHPASLMKLDSPNTTSATTYKIQIGNSGGTQLGCQLPTKLILMEVAG